MEASPHAKQVREGLARVVTALLETWGLEGERRLELLGMHGKDCDALTQ